MNEYNYTLYVYHEETLEVEAIINGNSNDECENRAAELNYCGDEWGWTYSNCDIIFGACIDEHNC